MLDYENSQNDGEDELPIHCSLKYVIWSKLVVVNQAQKSPPWKILSYKNSVYSFYTPRMHIVSVQSAVWPKNNKSGLNQVSRSYWLSILK